MKEHTHSWVILKGTQNLPCTKKDCNTVSDLMTVLQKTAKAAATAGKLELLVEQLRKRELKKAAHDAAYALVLSSQQPIITSEQGVLPL